MVASERNKKEHRDKERAQKPLSTYPEIPRDKGIVAIEINQKTSETKAKDSSRDKDNHRPKDSEKEEIVRR